MDNVRIIIYADANQIENRGEALGIWDSEGISQNVHDIIKTKEFPQNFYQWSTTNNQIWDWDIRWNWSDNEKTLFSKYHTPFIVFVNGSGEGRGDVYAVLNRENAKKTEIAKTLRGIQAAKMEGAGVYSITMPDGKTLIGDPLDTFSDEKKKQLQQESGAGSFETADGKTWGLSIPIFPRFKFPQMCDFLDKIGMSWACSMLNYWWVIPVVGAAYYVWKDNHDNEAAKRIVMKALKRS
jgi:hypothetical protein